MPSYTVPINGPNGPGFMTVNANSQAAAEENASQGGNYATGGAVEGGHQAHTGAGGTAVAGYAPGYNASGLISNQSAVQTAAAAGNAAQYGAAIDKMLQAIAEGNQKAFDETVREWNLVFGFDQTKFQEDVRQYNTTFAEQQRQYNQNFQEAMRQYNENLALQQAGLTGVYQGQATQQALNQMYTQQMGVISAAQAAQANPFRQAQLYGQAQRVLAGQPVAGFQAPGVVAGVGTAGGNTQGGMGYLQQMIEDIRNPTPNQTTADSFLSQTPTPNKIDSASFLRANPSTQNIVLQAMNEKYGIDPSDALNQIKNTLPQFRAPSVVGTVQR